MAKVEFVQEYIDKCNEILDRKDKHEAKKYQEIIIAVFEPKIPSIKNMLDNYRGYFSDEPVDFLGDLLKLEQILIGYLTDLEREDEIRKYELEKLQLQKSITIQNTLSATTTVTVTIEQTTSNISSIPKEGLSDEEKSKLVADLSQLGLFKGDKPILKEKLSNILKYVADKGFEVGKAVLPLILEYMKNS